MSPTAPPPRFGLLRTIAVYKIAKVLLLLTAAYGELRLRDASVVAKLFSWASTLPSGREQDALLRGLVWFSGLSAARVKALGIVTLAYALIFAIEGVGLWLRRRWGEWLTIVITASLVPLEIWEIARRPTFGKVLVFLVNMAIVWYLIVQLRATAPAAARAADGNLNPS
ncbi:MAG TPA: DUF2127 domain-containing protein [Steroidobacteraceae bacterium]|nr:DUF2127 domain-containing protein [Steroidobacteraceae bacterium]